MTLEEEEDILIHSVNDTRGGIGDLDALVNNTRGGRGDLDSLC